MMRLPIHFNNSLGRELRVQQTQQRNWVKSITIGPMNMCIQHMCAECRVQTTKTRTQMDKTSLRRTKSGDITVNGRTKHIDTRTELVRENADVEL